MRHARVYGLVGIAALAVAAVAFAQTTVTPLPEAAPVEAVPLELFAAIATPDGLLEPDEAHRRARTKPVHVDLWPLLEELGGSITR